MRRVKRQRKVDFATFGHHVGRETLMVFNVTRTGISEFLAFKLVKQFFRVLAECINQNIQPAPVGHAQHNFLRAVAACPLDQLIQTGNQALATFKPKPFYARIAGTQILFEAFRCG